MENGLWDIALTEMMREWNDVIMGGYCTIYLQLTDMPETAIPVIISPSLLPPTPPISDPTWSRPISLGRRIVPGRLAYGPRNSPTYHPIWQDLV